MASSSETTVITELKKGEDAARIAYKLGQQLGSANTKPKVERIFWVGSGASGANLKISNLFMEDNTDAYESKYIDAALFKTKPPLRLNKNHSLCIFLSKSGTTQEVVEAAKIAKNKECQTIAITQNQNSPLSVICKHAIIIKKLASTQPDISQIALGMIPLGLSAGLMSCYGWQHGSALLDAISKMPKAVHNAQSDYKSHAKTLAGKYAKASHMLVIGGHYARCVAYTQANYVGKKMAKVCAEPVSVDDVLNGVCEIFTKHTIAIFLDCETKFNDERKRLMKLFKDSECNPAIIEKNSNYLYNISEQIKSVLSTYIAGAKLYTIFEAIAQKNKQDMAEMVYYGKSQ